MPDPKSVIIREASKKILTEFKRQNLPPDPDLIQVSIIAKINEGIKHENDKNKKTTGQKLKLVESLPPPVIAEILLKFYSIVFLASRVANDCGILAICQSDSAGKVFYNTDETEITRIIRQYQYDISDRSIRETLTHLQDQAPRVYLGPDPVLVPYKFSSDTRGRLPDELIVDKLVATGEFRILKSGASSDGRLIVRHYENGVRTGIWEIVNIMGPDKNYGTPGTIINNLGGAISSSRKLNILLSLRDRLKNTAGGQSSILLEGFDNCLVPCRNGVYNMKDHTFMDYTDPAFLDKYGEIPFTYKLDTAYNPDALKNIPQKWDPLLGLAELFAGKTPRAHELADATRAMIQNQCDARAGMAAKAAITDRSIEACCLRVLLTMFQLAVRNYSGREGNIIFFDNLAGQAAGHNGKSTAADMIKFIIDHGSIPDYATRTSQPVFFVYTNGCQRR